MILGQILHRVFFSHDACWLKHLTSRQISLYGGGSIRRSSVRCEANMGVHGKTGSEDVMHDITGTISTVDTLSKSSLEAEKPKKESADAPGAECRCFRSASRKLCAPCSWLSELYAVFGKFIPVVVLTYGVTQAIPNAMAHSFAMKFYMKDILGLDGATMGRMLGCC